MNNKRSRENGQAIVLLAFAFIGLIGFTALAIDGGMVYSDRRHAQNAADAASLAGGGQAALSIENNHIFYSSFNCNNLTTQKAVAQTAAENFAMANGYAMNDFAVTFDCNDTGSSIHVDKYLDVTTTISETTQTSLVHFFYEGDVEQTVVATTRVRPRQPLVFGNAIVALNDAGCSGQQNGQGFHGNSGVDVIGGGIFSNGCLRGDGGVEVDVTNGSINYFDTTGIDPDDFNPLPAQLSGDENRIPSDAFTVSPPDCTNGFNVSASAIEGSTLAPGLYCVSGTIRVNNNNDSFSGEGVTIYMLDGAFIVNGGVVDISAPVQDPDPSPALPGMLLMFAPGNSSDILFNGNSGSQFTGTILAPESDIDMLGNGDTDGYQCQVIGYNVEAGGTADTFVQYDDASQYSKPTWLDLQE
jgi:hypothetical protein